MFKKNLVKSLDLPVKMIEGKGRYYQTPEGLWYPSITTVLGHASDSSWLDEWKERVGEAEAKKVSVQAARNGSSVHDILEKYIRGDLNFKKGFFPYVLSQFYSIKPVLDKHLDHIYALEIPLYSNKIRTAGRMDCGGLWDCVPSIVDFKTSRRKKKKEDITNYFIQASVYAYMFFERYGTMPEQIVILIICDDDLPIVYVEKPRKYLEQFIEIINRTDLQFLWENVQ